MRARRRKVAVSGAGWTPRNGRCSTNVHPVFNQCSTIEPLGGCEHLQKWCSTSHWVVEHLQKSGVQPGWLNLERWLNVKPWWLDLCWSVRLVVFATSPLRCWCRRRALLRTPTLVLFVWLAYGVVMGFATTYSRPPISRSVVVLPTHWHYH